MESRIVRGVKCYAPKNRKELIDFAFEKKAILVAVNAEKILHSTDESRAIINRNFGYPDGVGAVWALRKKGIGETVKIPGCELWLDIVREHAAQKSFYLIGGKQEVIEQTIQKLNADFSGINIVNYRNGYLNTPEEKQRLIEDIENKRPDVIFVAMGSPKQELLMEELSRIHPAVYQGLGGSFDVYTGTVKRASEWWVRNNLEWAYRLLKQPSRVKRQIHLVRFYTLLKLNRL
jgi:UDP-N-acetyl-D-mannosaminouronate:lipid I N-acetyl-D-mannosaminouronosyltransferase